MREILLTRKMKTYLDDEAWSVFKDYNWLAQPAYTRKPKKYYLARREVFINSHRFSLYLHRQVMGVPRPFVVKHKSFDHLDNQHNNLQIEDESGRIYFFRKFTTRSQYKGVIWDRFYGMWRSELHRLVIGYYPVEIDAARAYNIKIKEIYGYSKRKMNSIKIMREYNRHVSKT